MGYAKEMMMREQDNERAMADLLVPLGYLSKCPIHDDIYIDEMAGSDADEIADEIDEADREQFGTRAELKNAIKGALGNAGDGCPICDKNMADD